MDSLQDAIKSEAIFAGKFSRMFAAATGQTHTSCMSMYDNWKHTTLLMTYDVLVKASVERDHPLAFSSKQLETHAQMF